MQKLLSFVGKSLMQWASYLVFVFLVGLVSKITADVFMIGWNLL